MAAGDIKILGQKESTAFLPGGQTQKVIITTFQLGTDGPYTVSQPEDGFDANTQHQLILDKAAKLNAARTHPQFKT